MSKPTKEDAQLLLQLEQMLLMEPNQRALHWFWRVFFPREISDILENKGGLSEQF